LNPETLNALAALMLAQAQEIFVTKAIQDKMKDAIVAKLCVQADEMFADALR
jgi:programmed cell death 6-interacting protein